MTQAKANQTWIVNLGFGLTCKVLESKTLRQAKVEAKQAGAYGLTVYSRETKEQVCELRFA